MANKNDDFLKKLLAAFKLVARMQAKGRNPGAWRDTFPDSATLHPGYLFGSGLFGWDHG